MEGRGGEESERRRERGGREERRRGEERRGEERRERRGEVGGEGNTKIFIDPTLVIRP